MKILNRDLWAEYEEKIQDAEDRFAKGQIGIMEAQVEVQTLRKLQRELEKRD